MQLAAERAAEGIDCHPAGVVALLLTKGAPVAAVTADGMTALAFCERHRKEHECAEACACMLEEWENSRTLEVTRL